MKPENCNFSFPFIVPSYHMAGFDNPETDVCARGYKSGNISLAPGAGFGRSNRLADKDAHT